MKIHDLKRDPLETVLRWCQTYFSFNWRWRIEDNKIFYKTTPHEEQERQLSQADINFLLPKAMEWEARERASERQ